MAQQRSRTLIEHLGFNDPDLTSPAHDAMILWIAEHVREYVEKNHDPWRGIAQQIKWAEDAIQAELERRQKSLKREEDDYIRGLEARQIGEYPSYPYNPMSPPPVKYRTETPQEVKKRMTGRRQEVDESREKLRETQQLIGKPIPRPEAPPVGIQTEFEKTITTGRDFIVGFIDVVATVDYPGVYAAHLDWSDTRDTKIIGYNDRPPQLLFANKTEFFYFEAKPQIRSLGELLRQIRTYQEYTPKFEEYAREKRANHFVIVSPDTRFRAAIVSQGIEFWESPSISRNGDS